MSVSYSELVREFGKQAAGEMISILLEEKRVQRGIILAERAVKQAALAPMPKLEAVLGYAERPFTVRKTAELARILEGLRPGYEQIRIEFKRDTEEDRAWVQKQVAGVYWEMSFYSSKDLPLGPLMRRRRIDVPPYEVLEIDPYMIARKKRRALRYSDSYALAREIMKLNPSSMVMMVPT